MSSALSLGPAQAQAGVLFAIGLVVTIFIFALVAVKSRTASPYTKEYHRAYTRWRTVAFVLVVVALVTTFGFYWKSLPYADLARAAENRQVVKVDSLQFHWVVTPETDDKQIRAGVPVEFQVTAADVNHAFGLYDDQGVLLFQVQAMPTYQNRAVWTFERAGTYRIVCTEFCGSAHHLMMADLTVVN